MNSWPKVTKVDLKITKKWSVYEVKLFYGGHWGTPLTDPLKYMKKYTCQYVWISRWVALGMEKLSLNAFWLHKSCIKHHQNSSERAETLTDFLRGCDNNDASVGGSKIK